MAQNFSLDDGFIDIEGRKKILNDAVWCGMCVLSFGSIYALSRHYINIRIYITTKKCALNKADCVIITNQYGVKTIVNILEIKVKKGINNRRFVNDGIARILDTEYCRFVFDFSTNKFMVYHPPLGKNFDFETYYKSVMSKEESQESVELEEKLVLYGRNVSSVRLPSVFEIFLNNMFSISLMVNLLCIILWFMIEYKAYASIIGMFVLFELFQDLYADIKHKRLLEKYETNQIVQVVRNRKFIKCDAKNLFPGDIIYIEPCKEFYCDAMVVQGDVIVDESFLTGESLPICKSSAKNEMIYSGTSVLKSINSCIKNDNSNIERLFRVKSLIDNETCQQNSLDTNNFQEYAIEIVRSTGFNTTRGQLMKNILNPKPVYVKFLRDAIRTINIVIFVSLLLNIFLFIYLYNFRGHGFKDSLIYSLDIFFTLAAPALPTSINVGTQLSSNKLKKAGIHCKNINRIFLAANVNITIFDKTGTLTCEGMNLHCVDNLEKSFTNSNSVDFITKLGLSTCHSVYELGGKFSGDSLDIEMFIFSNSKLKENAENKRIIILGDHSELFGPFLKERGTDEEMYFYQDSQKPVNFDIPNVDDKSSQHFVINMDGNEDIDSPESSSSGDSKDKGNTYEIIKTYDFDSNLRRMSVIVTNGDKKYLFCKGSPDSVESIIKNKPKNYKAHIKNYTTDGFRVITLAYREIDEIVDRKTDEANLNFVSLVVFSNKLKPESKDVIGELKNAGIKSIICTGDNVLTAISVARECGIIDSSTMVVYPIMPEICKEFYDVQWICIGEKDASFDNVKLELYINGHNHLCEDYVIVCEGKEYDFFKRNKWFDFILDKAVIFARFNPSQKKQLVEDLRDYGKVTLFCGDGANDSGALGSADVSIALTEKEAGLASSFTSNSIVSVLTVIKEGRSSYVTSVARFKFVLVSYILEYASLAFLILRNNFLSDFQNIHIDIFIILGFIYLITQLNRSDKISKEIPNVSLFEVKDFLPILISLAVQLLFVAILTFLGNKSDTITETSLTATCIFYVTSYQYVFNAIFLSDCYPYSERIFANKKFLSYIVVILLINTALLLYNIFNFEFIDKYLHIYCFVEIPRFFATTIIFMLLLSLIFCLFLPFIIKKYLYNKSRKAKDE